MIRTDTTWHRTGYRYVYIDELLYNEELRQLALDKVGRFELAYVINGSIYGTRVGNSINQDCGDSTKKIPNVLVVKDCLHI